MIDSFTGEYAFLSNFFPCKVRDIWSSKKDLALWGSQEFQSSEAAFQAQKTEEFFLREPFQKYTAAKAKRMGRGLELREDWEYSKIHIMYRILWAKFTQNLQLAQLLLNTGEEELIEKNDWYDHFWGMCGGRGENHLGICLMMLRDQFRDMLGEDKYLNLQKSLLETGIGWMRCYGESMEPVLHNGSKMTFQKQDEYEVGDAVYCRLSNSGALIDCHLILDKSNRRGYLIGNYHGHKNGWARTIYGKAIQAELNGQIYWVDPGVRVHV
jgi:hypothetical protein